MSHKMVYEVVEDRRHHGDFRVEAINYAGDGEIYIAIFTGPQAKERASEYAVWKNAGAAMSIAA